MKFLSYILLLLFILSISGRIVPWYSIKKTKKLSELKSTSESSDVDEESKADDKNEKEDSEKFITVFHGHVALSIFFLENKHQLLLNDFLLISHCKEVIIPPPEKA